MSDVELLREAQRVLRSLVSRTRLTLQEEREPDHVPDYRIVEVHNLAEDPLHGDARGLLAALDARLKPTPWDNIGGDIVTTVQGLASLDAKGYTATPLYGDLFLADKGGWTWLVEEDGAVVKLGHGALVSLKRELDKRLGV